jgi:hypothetical protein
MNKLMDEAADVPRETSDDERRVREALAAEVRGDEEFQPLEAIDAGREVVRSTWDVIQSALAERRAARAAIDEEIRALVAEEELWKPIIRRIETGKLRRESPSRTSGDSQASSSPSTEQSSEPSG